MGPPFLLRVCVRATRVAIVAATQTRFVHGGASAQILKKRSNLK